MSTEVMTKESVSTDIQEKVLIGGDLSKLSTAERLSYYQHVCESLGLNPLTRPFEYLVLQGKLILYARKDATEQLRSRPNREVSITNLVGHQVNDVYIVTASAEMNGRTDIATGAVNIKGLSGDFLANMLMKAETKAKRRVTLSICGLGMLDETELETIPEVKPKKGPREAISEEELRQADKGVDAGNERPAEGPVTVHDAPASFNQADSAWLDYVKDCKDNHRQLFNRAQVIMHLDAERMMGQDREAFANTMEDLKREASKKK